jgi:hypothetical protein
VVLATSTGVGVAPLGAGLFIEMGSLLAEAGAEGSSGYRVATNRFATPQNAAQSGVATGRKYMIFHASCKPFHAVLECH